jgi:hypothetical protein
VRLVLFLSHLVKDSRGFLVQFELTPYSVVHAHQIFVEMTKMTLIYFWSDFYHQSRTCSCQHRFIFPLRFITRFQGPIALV